jgi:hypothetical protein
VSFLSGISIVLTGYDVQCQSDQFHIDIFDKCLTWVPSPPAHRRPDVHTTELTSFRRQIYAVTYGDPPDPPAVAAVLAALTGRDEAGGDQRAG